MPSLDLLSLGNALEGARLSELLPLLLGGDYMLAKVAFAAALAVLLMHVRRNRPKRRVIFNF